STNGSATSTSASGTVPVWLRLQRTGSSFTASRSTNGTSWTTIGTQSISMAATIYVGLAVTSHDPGARAGATFDSVSLAIGSTKGLPSGWTSGDIGSGALRGSAAYGSGVFTIDGSGADVWGRSDAFRFTYRQVSGDVDIVARVASLADV